MEQYERERRMAQQRAEAEQRAAAAAQSARRPQTGSAPVNRPVQSRPVGGQTFAGRAAGTTTSGARQNAAAAFYGQENAAHSARPVSVYGAQAQAGAPRQGVAGGVPNSARNTRAQSGYGALDGTQGSRTQSAYGAFGGLAADRIPTENRPAARQNAAGSAPAAYGASGSAAGGTASAPNRANVRQDAGVSTQDFAAFAAGQADVQQQTAQQALWEQRAPQEYSAAQADLFAAANFADEFERGLQVEQSTGQNSNAFAQDNFGQEDLWGGNLWGAQPSATQGYGAAGARRPDAGAFGAVAQPYGAQRPITEQTFDLDAQQMPPDTHRQSADAGELHGPVDSFFADADIFDPAFSAQQIPGAYLPIDEPQDEAGARKADTQKPRAQEPGAHEAMRGAHAKKCGTPDEVAVEDAVPASGGGGNGTNGGNGNKRGKKGGGEEPPAPPRKKKHRLRRLLLTALCLVIVASTCFLGIYLKIATQNDFLWLDLEQLRHRDATVLYGQAEDGSWAEYARLESTQQKQWVDLAEVPTELQHAFVAIEDKNFYKHNGVSLTRTAYAILNELKHSLTGTYFGGENGIKQGASTIDQQLIKNLTYDDDVGGVEGYLRKIREIYRAYKMDADYSKDTIMEAYLNVISFTGNTAGVQAESLKLFGVPVSQLTLEQCASIAAITKNPYRYDPTRNPDVHLTRRNYILYEMWQQKYISEEQYNTASAQPIGLSPTNVDVPETPVTSYFTDQVIEEVKADLSAQYGLDGGEITRLLYDGGLRIYTTVDLGLQGVMENAMLNGSQFFPQPGVQSTRPVYNEDGTVQKDEAGNTVYEDYTETPQAAMVSIDYNGALKAVVGGVGEKTVSRAFNRGTRAERQVGSTMKPIGPYVLGLEDNKINWSSPFLDSYVKKIKDEATGELREWPINFSKTYSDSDILVRDAMAQSINTIAVRVGQKAGTWNIYNFVRNKLHISSFTFKDCAAGPMVLGSSTYGVTPYELAGAYMMFGNGGKYTTLHSYTSVQTGYGREIAAPKLTTEQVISPDTAYVMNRLLEQVMAPYGTAYGYSVKGEMDSVGKTGTSTDNRDFWFVGLTPYYVTATWYGYDSGYALNTSAGTHAPTSAWKYVMERAQRNLPALEFPVDDTVVEAEYCTETGGLATAACPSTDTGYYRSGQLPQSCRVHKAA